MNSVTFFGEVNELKSRAIWWSDSDSEEYQFEHNVNKDLEVVINTDNHINCDSIFISLAKNDKIVVKELTKLGFITINGMNGIIANIYDINKTSIWIQSNANYPTLKNYLLVKTINNLMKQIFSKFKSITDKSNEPLIQIISKDLMTGNTSNDVINYLSNNNNNLKNITKNSKDLGQELLLFNF